MGSPISAAVARATCVLVLSFALWPGSRSWGQAHTGLPTDPDAVIVQELVVTAHYPGPALWSVTNGASTVFVLGVPAVAPKGLLWADANFKRHLVDANRVILPFNSIGFNVLSSPVALFSMMRLNANTPYEDNLGPALKARFIEARTRIGQPAKHYSYNNGMAVALYLATDYRRSVGLTSNEISMKIASLASASKIKVERKLYDVTAINRAIAQTPAAIQAACVDDVIKETEDGPDKTVRAAEAWAKGDVRTALLEERSYERCFAAAPGAGNLDARMKADEADAIAKALETPGHAIAVVQLRPLLASGGVLDRLKARGFSVKTPGEN